jgi:YVTN family beta-propeller protein
VATGDRPGAIVYNSLNNKVYCADYGSDRVTVIGGATNEVLDTIRVGHCPADLCHNPQQNRVYVANSMSSSISVLRDSGGGIEEVPNDEARATKAATIVRGVLFMAGHRVELLDAAGRKVMDLQPGANDVRHLAAGIYFVRAASRELSAVSCRKVVIQR